MDNKKSRLFLCLGMLVGVTSTIFFILYKLSNKNMKSFSTILYKYIKIPDDEKKSELVEDGEELTLEVSQDDLKVINGIGPVIEALLNENNIFTFLELSTAGVNDLRKMLEKKNLRLANPETWPAQAKQFLN